MIDYETGNPHTAHTTNPVPFILVNADPSYKLREGGCLADIAPTLLEIMGLPQPKEMTGKSLIVSPPPPPIGSGAAPGFEPELLF